MTARAQPLLGVLGGMGPAATADFYQKFIRMSPVTRDQDHARVVIWADPTIPPRSTAVLDGTDAPYPLLLAGARVLRDVGATVVAMPCNTAHVFLPRLIRDTGIPFLDMITATVNTVISTGGAGGTVGILGTRGTICSGLYQHQLAAAGLSRLEPSGGIQQRTDEAIAWVKAGDLRAAQIAAVDAIRRLRDGGATRIILACTELPVALNDHGRRDLPPLVDPTAALAQAAVTAYWQGQLLPSGTAG